MTPSIYHTVRPSKRTARRRFSARGAEQQISLLKIGSNYKHELVGKPFEVWA